jgi:photosystem II stability/assembly factor-like uncharacterized protein
MSNNLSRKLLLVLITSLAMLLATAWGVVASFSSTDNDPPVINNVTPQDLPSLTNMNITVTGQSFAPTPTLTLTLGDVLLQDVTVINTRTLTALVPWGLPVGSYTLTLTNPDGLSATLANACNLIPESGNWESNGPYGGEMHDVFIDPLNGQKVYAIAWSSGLFVSEDAAENWQPLYINPMPVDLAFQDDNGVRRLYIGGDNQFVRSEDDGVTWEHFLPDEMNQKTSHNPYDFHAAVNPAEPDAIYLGASGNSNVTVGSGLYKYSYATGEWSKLYPADLHVTSVTFDPADPDRIYFGTRDGQFYASPDGGLTWTDPLTISTHIHRIVVDPFINGSGHHNIWVVSDGYGYFGDGAYFSLDGGLIFQHLDNLPNTSAQVTSISFHPVISETIWLSGSDGGYFTTDNGANWTTVPGSLNWTEKFALFPDPTAPTDPARMTVYAATDRGVFKSVDGGQNWVEANQGLAGVVPEGLAVNPFNPDEAYASTRSLNILKTRDGGRTWQQLDIPFAGYRARLAVDPFDTQIVYFPCNQDLDACLRISPDGGDSYQTVVLTRPVGIADEWSGRSVVIAPDPQNPGRLLAGAIFEIFTTQEMQGVIYRRADVNAPWEIIKVLAGQLYNISFDPHNALRVYATSDEGLFRSEDGGETWNMIPLPDGLDIVSLVTVHPDDAQIIYIYNWGTIGEDTPNQSVFYSEDDGLTWTMLTDSNGERVYTGPVWDIGFAPTGPRAFYMATFAGLFRSLDGGHTITPVAGLPGQANAQSLAFGSDGDRLVIYVGSTGGYTTAGNASINSVQIPQAGLMGAGIYRSNTMFHYLYLPSVSR